MTSQQPGNAVYRGELLSNTKSFVFCLHKYDLLLACVCVICSYLTEFQDVPPAILFPILCSSHLLAPDYL